jgi:Ca2+/H+ antiporter, TMEM165/GDT1 family
VHSFWVALVFTFLAEMGDKTQVVAMLYASRYGFRTTALGILWAIGVVLLISSLVGNVIGAWLPQSYLHAASAVCFIGFGLWELLGKDDSDELAKKDGQNPILFIGSAFLLAEMGDKTMFSTLTLAATRSWLSVWLGSTVGMAASDGLGIGLGHWFGKRLPEKQLRWVAALTFFGFGLWTGIQAWQMFAVR